MDRTGGNAEQVGRRGLIGAAMAIAMLSMSVWTPHMLVTGQVLLLFFSFLSYLMLLSIGFLVTFLLGGLTGVLLASPPVDLHVHSERVSDLGPDQRAGDSRSPRSLTDASRPVPSAGRRCPWRRNRVSSGGRICPPQASQLDAPQCQDVLDARQVQAVHRVVAVHQTKPLSREKYRGAAGEIRKFGVGSGRRP
jgi:hypothetical protein